MLGPILTGERLSLLPASLDDLPIFCRWFADREMKSGRYSSEGHDPCSAVSAIACWGVEVVKKVLIVEDEHDVAALIAGVLDLEGYEPRLAVGETAMDHAHTFNPDVVLLDLMMPVVNGFEVARLLHADPDTARIPIVVMTAMHDAASRATEVGAADFLAKPFDIDDLLQRIEQATA